MKFGRGAIDEVGAEAAALGPAPGRALHRPPPGAVGARRARARARCARPGSRWPSSTEVRIEPTDGSFRAAAEFAREARVDGYVSVGGGSTIDTAKAANLYATYPAPFERYVNAPLGEGAPVPGPLAPHIACPTTSGTGSECTGIAIFDFVAHDVKTGIASRRLRPTLGHRRPRRDPHPARGGGRRERLRRAGHALESFTARPYTQRPRPATPAARPLSQGANP